jgi:hypothetical protein
MTMRARRLNDKSLLKAQLDQLLGYDFFISYVTQRRTVYPRRLWGNGHASRSGRSEVRALSAAS